MNIYLNIQVGQIPRWINLYRNGIVIHAIYADDILHFTNNKAMYQDFQKQFKKRFEVKTGSVGVYPGNHIKVDDAKLLVELNQSDYIEGLLECYVAVHDLQYCMLYHTPAPSILQYI